MEFRVAVSNEELSKCIKQISAWDGKTRLAVEDALRKGTKAVQRQAVQRVAVRTKKLKKSIKQGFSTTKLEGKVYSNLPYAHLVEYGSRATVIRPKKKKALKIPYDNGFTFAKRANIPAKAPHPFMKPAYEYEEPHIIAAVRRAITKE